MSQIAKASGRGYKYRPLGGMMTRAQEEFAMRLQSHMLQVEPEDLEATLEGFVLSTKWHDLHAWSLWQRFSNSLIPELVS
jgi:hypothetical protein